MVADWPLVRAVTGIPTHWDSHGSHAWLATDEKNTRVLGVALAVIREGQALIWLEVLPEFRRAGIGHKLWQQIDDRCTTEGVESLLIWKGMEDEVEGISFVSNRGFEKDYETVSFEVSIERYLRSFEAWSLRLGKRLKVPAGMKLYNGKEVDLLDVQQLLNPHFGLVVREQIGRMVANGLTLNDWVNTVRVGKELVAAVIGHVEGEVLVTDAYAIEPAYQNGWAALYARFYPVRDVSARRPELKVFRASAATKFPDTIKLAKRIGATITQGQWVYHQKRTQS
jgi:GNAT superfamily N-acetyltransferase